MQTFVLLLATIVASALAQQYAVSITHADNSPLTGADLVKKGNSIQYKFSLPGAGAGQLTSSCSSATRCYVRVVLTADIARDIGLSQCYLEWFYSTVTGTVEQDLADKIVTVYAKENYIAGGAVHTISAVVETNTALFANQAQNIQVDTRDSRASATCSIWGDPHYITFDATGSLGQWDATYPISSHVIVAAPYRNFEIQSITKGWGPVTGGNAGITCAFAAREGNDIVYFNFCTGQANQGIYAVFNSPKDAQPTVVHSGARYTINFRSGTQFSVDVNGGASGYLAGHVTVPGSDFGKGLFGACGNFDGDATNDVPTSTTGARKGFGNNPTTQAQLEAVFGVVVKNYETNPRSLWNWSYDPRNVTLTSTAASECNPAPVSGPTVTTGGKDITALLLVQPGAAATTSYDVPTDTLEYAALTAEEVLALCTDKLAGSSLGQVCLNSGAISQGVLDGLVQNCVVDIALTGGQASFIADAFVALQTVCLQNVYAGSPGFNFGAWTAGNGASFVCENGCSGNNGQCVNGVCVCNEGFANTDCSVDTTATPSINWVSPVNIDVNEPSTFARIHGSAFWSDAAIKINGVAVSGFVYVDSFTVGIDVLSAGFSAGDSAEVTVTSGSGKTSNAVTITFFDGSCYSEPGVERTDVCFLTTGGCAAAGSSECNPTVTGTSTVDLPEIAGGARRSAGSVSFGFVAGTIGDSAASWSVDSALVSIDSNGVVTGTGAAAWKAAGLDLDTYDWANWANDADAFAHSFTVSVTSTLGLTASHFVSLAVGSQSSINRAPYFGAASAAVIIAENGQSVDSSLGATDPDHDSIDYSVDSASFTVDSNGLLSIASGVDLCCATSFSVLLTATDAFGASSSLNVLVNVDLAPNGCTPFDLNLAANSFDCSAQAGAGSAFSVGENSNINQAVFASDKDASDSFTFQVTGGDSTGFSFSGNSLQHAGLDFENPTDADQDNVYDVEVTVTDGSSHSYTQTVSVTVTDVAEAPSQPTSNGFLPPSESSSNVVIGSVSSLDDSLTPVTTFNISSGFSIDNFGQVTVLSVPDYESASLKTLTFTVTAHASGLSASATFTVDILDINETPSISFARGASASVLAENTVGTAIGSISYSDPDSAQPALYGVSAVSLASVSGGACNCFTLSGNTILSANLNFESLTTSTDGKRYATCVATVTDFGGLSASVSFNVQVTNVNEDPTGVSVDAPFVTEYISSSGRTVGDAIGTLIGPINFNDQEDPTGSTFTVTAIGSQPTSSRFTAEKNSIDNRWYIKTRVIFNYEGSQALGAPVGSYQPVGFSVTVSFTDTTNNKKFTLPLGNPTVGYGIQVKDAPHDFTLEYDNIYVATAKDGAAVGTGVVPFDSDVTTSSIAIFLTTGFDYTTQLWSVVNSTNKASDGSEDAYFFPGADYLYIQPTIFGTSASYPRTLRIKKSLTTWGKNTIKFTIRLERENITAVALYPGTTNPQVFPQYKTFTLNVTQRASSFFAFSNASVVYDLGTAADTNIFTFPANAAYSNYQLVGAAPDFADPDYPVFIINPNTGRISNPDMLNTEVTWQLIISADVNDGSTVNGVVNVQVIDKSTAGTGCLNTTAGFANSLPLCISTTVQTNCRESAGTQWMCTCNNATANTARVVDCVRPLAASSSASSAASASTVVGVVVAIVILVAIVVGVVLAITRSRRGKQNIAIAGVDSEGQAIIFNKGSYTSSGEVAYDASAVAASEATVATWYHPRMSREECEDYLANLGEGAFVVRESTFTPGWHMMAVKTANTVVHERIKLNADGTFQMLPATNVSQPSFRTMSELVEFYSAGKHEGVAFSLALDNPMYDNHLLREQASMDAAHEPVAVPSTTEADAPLLPSRSGDL